ncbi:disease resistance protein RPV1 isoform X2 [Cryptomeria japonica]|uniref:disease resistance protein RPV1 isoform X2 n=1 Tax=Cryptomeria japonica TaxID=3369 RepID=UPI0027DA3882|nr:disease resistance protein RPV1 isoform X2 [Cryptomeria japonica]
MFDVFLSFRGPDTRQGFVRRLYSALDREGIRTFLDKESLHKGDHIPSSLCQGISASTICIPVFSKNFVQSKWCLKEVLHMLECQVEICPVFYDVLPEELRCPDGSKYAYDLNRYEGTKFIIECRNALKLVSNLSGWCFNPNSGEDVLIRDVLKDIVKILRAKFPDKVYLDVPECFGLEWPVEQVRSLLNTADHQRKMVKVGIRGMGGIGKTTLAKFVYKHLYSQFEVRAFVLSVGERCREANQVVKMQSRMLRDVSQFRGEVDHVDQGKGLLKDCLQGKRVLLLLDDIQSPEQLEAFAGKFMGFGAGSRVIITSRDGQILKLANVDEVYEVRGLSYKHAMELFNFNAFPNSSCPDQELQILCKDIVSSCEGLPLALSILGKTLVGQKDRNVWKDTVDKFRCEPNMQKKLETSYHTLDYFEKEIFQDIACFLTWREKEIAMIFWGELKWNPYSSVEHLLQKSLVNLGPGNKLLMHSCLRDLGRSIANEISREPRKRTRLFDEQDVHHVLCRPWEKAKNARYLSYEPKEPMTLKAEMFKSLYNLQLLWLGGVVIEGHFSEPLRLEDLRWLRLRSCSSKSLPPGMNLKSLIILEVTDSQITVLWDERAEQHPNLWPRKLKVLNLSGCASLMALPATPIYSNLKILNLKNCHSLTSLPNTVGNLRSLDSLNMEGCGVSSLPEGFGDLSNLQKLKLSWCKHLCSLPASFGNLNQLVRLEIHHNAKLTELPGSTGGLKALSYLDASYCQLSDNGLPAGILELSSLRIIHLEHNVFHNLPGGLEKLSGLWELHLDGCSELSALPVLPPSLEILSARDCMRLDTLSCFSGLTSLSRLDVSNSHRVTELPGLQSLQGLTTLEMVGCKHIFTHTLGICLRGLKSLESVFIGGPGVSPSQLQSLYDSLQCLAGHLFRKRMFNVFYIDHFKLVPRSGGWK